MVEASRAKEYLKKLEAVSKEYGLALSGTFLTVHEGTPYYAYIEPQTASAPDAHVDCVIIND